MTYREITEKHQEEFNKLPIFFAFGKEQFERALAERGIKVEEARQHIYRFGDTGGFYLKKDAPQIHAFLAQDFARELREMMEADLSLAKEAFEYEMANHEYPINWEGDYDVCSCFGNIVFDEEKTGMDYLEELGFSKEVINVYYTAWDKI